MINPAVTDIGRKVTYVPDHAHDDLVHANCEHGYITSFNKPCVFVRYGLGSTSAGTNREDLYWARDS